MTANRVSIGVDSNTKGAEAGLDRVGRKAEDLGKKLSSVGSKMTRRLTLPLAAAAAGAFRLASDLGEATSQARQVFGRGADGIIAAAQNMSDSFSETEFLSFASNLGDIAQGMGFARGEADDLATGVLSLAQDLGSFKNLPTEQAIQAITAALTGERESLKSLGIVINEEMVKQKAMEMGLADSTGKLDQQAKAQATLALITEASANAIGDFDRTSDGAANQTRILAANFKDTAATLGQDLIPIGMQLLSWAQSVVGAFGNMSPVMQKTTLISLGLVAALGPMISLATRLVTAFTAVRSAALLLAGSTGIGAAVVAVGALAAGFLWLAGRQKVGTNATREAATGMNELSDAALQLKATLDSVTGAATDMTKEHIASELAAAGLADEFDNAGLSIDTLLASVNDYTHAGFAASEEVTRFSRSLRDNENVTDAQREAFHSLVMALIDVGIEQSAVNRLLGEGEDALTDTGDAARDTSAMIDRHGGAVGQLSDKYSDLVGMVDKAINALRRINGGQVAVDEAVIDLARDVDDLTASILENGRNWDIGTEAGRANTEAARENASSIRELELALIGNGMAAGDAAMWGDAYRESLRAQLIEAGLAADVVDALIDTYASVPEEVSTALVADIRSEVWNMVASWKEALKEIPEEVNTTITGSTIWAPGAKTILPHSHSGSVFRAPSPGGEGLAVLSDGQTVLPRGRTMYGTNTGGGGGMVTVPVQVVMPDGRVLAEVVAQANLDSGGQYQ